MGNTEPCYLEGLADRPISPEDRLCNRLGYLPDEWVRNPDISNGPVMIRHGQDENYQKPVGKICNHYISKNHKGEPMLALDSLITDPEIAADQRSPSPKYKYFSIAYTALRKNGKIIGNKFDEISLTDRPLLHDAEIRVRQGSEENLKVMVAFNSIKLKQNENSNQQISGTTKNISLPKIINSTSSSIGISNHLTMASNTTPNPAAGSGASNQPKTAPAVTPPAPTPAPAKNQPASKPATENPVAGSTTTNDADQSKAMEEDKSTSNEPAQTNGLSYEDLLAILVRQQQFIDNHEKKEKEQKEAMLKAKKDEFLAKKDLLKEFGIDVEGDEKSKMLVDAMINDSNAEVYHEKMSAGLKSLEEKNKKIMELEKQNKELANELDRTKRVKVEQSKYSDILKGSQMTNSVIAKTMSPEQISAALAAESQRAMQTTVSPGARQFPNPNAGISLPPIMRSGGNALGPGQVVQNNQGIPVKQGSDSGTMTTGDYVPPTEQLTVQQQKAAYMFSDQKVLRTPAGVEIPIPKTLNQSDIASLYRYVSGEYNSYGKMLPYASYNLVTRTKNKQV